MDSPLDGTAGIIEATPAERVIQTFVPMKWPEYLHVTDLPFSESLYATLDDLPIGENSLLHSLTQPAQPPTLNECNRPFSTVALW